MADIKIDGRLFHERLSHFINAWKADKRSGDALFGGVSSIVIMMGKVDEEPEFHKNNAMHVCLNQFATDVGSRGANRMSQFWLLGYEFPTTLMLLTLDTFYVLTTQKKGSHLPCALPYRLLTRRRSEIP